MSGLPPPWQPELHPRCRSCCAAMGRLLRLGRHGCRRSAPGPIRRGRGPGPRPRRARPRPLAAPTTPLPSALPLALPADLCPARRPPPAAPGAPPPSCPEVGAAAAAPALGPPANLCPARLPPPAAPLSSWSGARTLDEGNPAAAQPRHNAASAAPHSARISEPSWLYARAFAQMSAASAATAPAPSRHDLGAGSGCESV